MFPRLLTQVARALDEASIPYMLIGGQAVLLYGVPRLTQDVDITLGVTPQHLDKVLQVLTSVGLQPLVDSPESFVAKTWVLPVYDPASGLRFDFVFSWTPYEQQAFKRVRSHLLEGYPVRFASPEDVIIHKILANRPRDLEDVRHILRRQEVDADYIHQWLQSFSHTLGIDFVSIFQKLYNEEAGR